MPEGGTVGRRRRAVFLDRDGTINRNAPAGDFVRSPEALELLPGAAGAVSRLNAAGYAVVVISNQSGVARGMMTLGDVRSVNARLEELLALEGARLDGVYVCPHASSDGCPCRKPRPGLLTRAAEDLGLDLARSWTVGDSARDLEAGRAAGTFVVLVHGDSYPGAREEAETLQPFASVATLAEAVDKILGPAARPRPSRT
jgi:histidinol-phosphate phosphatase family protein